MAYAYQPSDDDAFEMAPSPLERAVAQASAGRVAWLTTHGERALAVLPADVAQRALDALEDAEDLAALEVTRDEPTRPWAEVRAELDAHWAREDATS